MIPPSGVVGFHQTGPGEFRITLEKEYQKMEDQEMEYQEMEYQEKKYRR